MENYTVLGLLGAGGFGQVVKCKCISSGHIYAMKRYNPMDDMQYIFQRELAPLSVLKHDNIVVLLEVFTHQGNLLAIFELLERSIMDELEQKDHALDSLIIRKYTFQILRAVEFVHSHHIIHRDIKPDNVLVSRLGVVKLADFGCARSSGNASLPRTNCEGTLWYMAPEVLVRDPSYSTPVDVWAIGCTIACMATGKPLLMGSTVRDQIEEVIMKVGPLTANQEQQYFACQKYHVDTLPTGNPPSDLLEKYNISESLLAQLMEACLTIEPVDRWSCSKMLGHPYFTADHFHESFSKELKEMVHQDQSTALMTDQDQSENPGSQDTGTLPDLSSASPQPLMGMSVEEERCSPVVENAEDGDDEDTVMSGCFSWNRRKARKGKPKEKGIRSVLRHAIGAFRRMFSSRVAPMV